MLMLGVGGISFIAASLASRNADTFLLYEAEIIRDWGYDEDIIKECKSDAKKQGYTLSIIRNGDEGEASPYGMVALEYPVYLMPFGIHINLKAMEVIY